MRCEPTSRGVILLALTYLFPKIQETILDGEEDEGFRHADPDRPVERAGSLIGRCERFGQNLSGG